MKNSNTTITTPVPQKQEYHYAVLMETSEEECESWYYFIRYEGNEDKLKSLNDQLLKANWILKEGLSTFDLDLEHLVSEKTAYEMCTLELNSCSFHRKFDGAMRDIKLKFQSTDHNTKKMKKAFHKLGYGQIDKYVDDEDESMREDEEIEFDDDVIEKLRKMDNDHHDGVVENEEEDSESNDDDDSEEEDE